MTGDPPPLDMELRSEGEADGFRSITAAAGILGILFLPVAILSCSTDDEVPMEDVDSVRMVGVTGVRAPGGS